MATVHFSVSDEVKEAFDRIIIAEFMRKAVDEAIRAARIAISAD